MIIVEIYTTLFLLCISQCRSLINLDFIRRTSIHMESLNGKKLRVITTLPVFRLDEDQSDADNAKRWSYDTDDLNLRERVLEQMILAFDNLPGPEVEEMHRALWNAKDENEGALNSCTNLIKWTLSAEEIEGEAVKRTEGNSSIQGLEDLEDAMRVTRSMIRMFGKDADFCRSNDDGSQSWLNSIKLTWLGRWLK